MITSKQVKVARQSLGLTQSVVSGETGISRSYLSQFENGQLALDKSAIEKIKSFFEQKGFDFGESNSQAEKAEKIEKVASSLEGRLVKKMGKGSEAVSVDVEDLSELVGLLGDYVVSTAQKTESDSDFSGRTITFSVQEDDSDKNMIFDDFNEANISLKEHFEKDLSGDTEIGFFSSREARASKLVCAMAIQYLRLMAMSGVQLAPVKSIIKAFEGGQFGKDAVAVGEMMKEHLSESSPELKNVVEAV